MDVDKNMWTTQSVENCCECIPGILQILSFGLNSSQTIDVIQSNWSIVPGPFCWRTSSVIFFGSPNVNLEFKLRLDQIFFIMFFPNPNLGVRFSGLRGEFLDIITPRTIPSRPGIASFLHCHVPIFQGPAFIVILEPRPPGRNELYLRISAGRMSFPGPTNGFPSAFA